MLGMLASGLILRNAAPELVDTLPSTWSKMLRTFALGMIFLRSGLELDIRIFKRVGPAATRLLLIPGLTEAFVTGGIAMRLLNLPVFYSARAHAFSLFCLLFLYFLIVLICGACLKKETGPLAHESLPFLRNKTNTGGGGGVRRAAQASRWASF